MMIPKDLLRFIVLGILWCFVGLSCKKDDMQPCETEGCCVPKVTSRVAATLNGIAIGGLRKGQQSVSLREVVYDKEPYNVQKKQITFMFLCDGQEEIINAFVNDEETKSGYNPAQQYKMWGWIYEDNFNSPPIIPDRIYVLKIKHIEKIP